MNDLKSLISDFIEISKKKLTAEISKFLSLESSIVSTFDLAVSLTLTAVPNAVIVCIAEHSVRWFLGRTPALGSRASFCG